MRGLCWELVVIDTGSTDRTVARAREMGAEVHHFDWTDDFAEARNFGLSHLSGEWVLMLDADEHLTPEAHQTIQEEVRNPDLLVVNLLRREIGAVQSPWSLVSRLFRRHPEVSFTRPYHAMIDDSVEALMRKESRWEIHDLSVPAIIHEGYRPEEIAGQNKAFRARQAIERYHSRHPEDPYVCSKLGALLHSTGETAKAESLLRTGLKATDDSWDSASLRFELHYHLGLLHRSREETKDAREHYQLALKQGLDPLLTIGAAFNLAALDQQENRLDQAIAGFQQIVKLVPDLGQAHLNLGMAYRAKKNERRAKAHYLEALKIDPNHGDAHRNLGVLHLQNGDDAKALRSFQRALACYDKHDPKQATSFRKLLASSGLRL